MAESSEPPLCPCGIFFGTSQTSGLCSKCFAASNASAVAVAAVAVAAAVDVKQQQQPSSESQAYGHMSSGHSVQDANHSRVPATAPGAAITTAAGPGHVPAAPTPDTPAGHTSPLQQDTDDTGNNDTGLHSTLEFSSSSSSCHLPSSSRVLPSGGVGGGLSVASQPPCLGPGSTSHYPSSSSAHHHSTDDLTAAAAVSSPSPPSKRIKLDSAATKVATSNDDSNKTSPPSSGGDGTLNSDSACSERDVSAGDGSSGPTGAAEKASDASGGSQTAAATASTSSSSSSSSPSTTPSKRRCGICKAKLQLAYIEMGRCDCGNVFCSLHRLPEQHQCMFDHKSKGRAKMEKEMVVPQRKVGTGVRRMEDK